MKELGYWNAFVIIITYFFGDTKFYNAEGEEIDIFEFANSLED